MKKLSRFSILGSAALIACTNAVSAADLVISNFKPWSLNENILSLDLDQVADSGNNGSATATLTINSQPATGNVGVVFWGVGDQLILYPDGITSPDVDSHSSWKSWYCAQTTTPTVSLTITGLFDQTGQPETFGGGNAFAAPQTYTADLSSYVCPAPLPALPPFGGNPNAPNSAAVASASIIQSDMARVTRSAITASNSMMSSGIARLVEQQQANDNVVSSNASALSLTPRFNVSETGGLSGGGSLFGDTMTAGGVYRRITTGEFDIQKETGTGTTLSFNGRMAWERSLNDQTVLGYFVGVEGNDSNLTSTFAGDHKRLAGSAGIYALTELSEGVFAAGYGSLGIAQSDLDVTDGTDAVTGDYTYNTMALGGQLSGSIKQEAYELQPTLSVNYSKSFVGDISLTQTTAGTASALAVAVGNTEFAELIASPRFLIPVAMAEGSTLTTVGVVAPRLLCEYSKSSGTSASNCGGGLELGLNSVSSNGMINFNAGLRFDRINGADRQALSLQGSMEF